MFYMQATIEVPHENAAKFVEILTNEFVPLAAKHGMRLVGSWQAAVGVQDEFTDLWAFDSLEQYGAAFRSAAKDPEFQKAFDRIRSVAVHEATKLLKPLPVSPLK